MSVHVEWVHAADSYVDLVDASDALPDGQTVKPGNVGLVLSGDDVVVIEGTPDEVRGYLSRALLALDR